ncbi:right-handed parallel beta-helix repeat-containing protein [Patescibacteria group bacterium]
MKKNIFAILTLVILIIISVNILSIKKENDTNSNYVNIKISKIDSNAYYIGKDGINHSDCVKGLENKPWKTYADLRTKKCLKPGDTIYIIPGIYTENSSIFEGLLGNQITFDGTADNPIKIIGAESDNNLDVRFENNLIVMKGTGGLVSNIEFFGKKPDRAVIMINGKNLTVKNSYIHGDQKNINVKKNKISWNTFDCIKILGTSENIDISDNEIAFCTEDAIDVTGAKNIIYRGNNIHDAKMMQVKGGTENILIENNIIHNLRLGIQGFAMSCPGDYCGGLHIPELAVEERFVAKNVTIKNNLFYDMYGNSIGPAGYIDTKIYNNTFHNILGSAFNPHKAGFDFYDKKAEQYCSITPSACETCGNSNECKKIEFVNKNIEFANNIMYSIANVKKASFFTNTGDHTNMKVYNNFYYNPKNLGEVLEDSKYADKTNKEIDPQFVNMLEKDFHLKSTSQAIDVGINFGIKTDLDNVSRDTKPDLGAYEHR